jgi:hypothetical protein
MSKEDMQFLVMLMIAALMILLAVGAIVVGVFALR